jgi:hypothetical protein
VSIRNLAGKSFIAAFTAGFALAGAGSAAANEGDDVLSDNLSDNQICGNAINVLGDGDANGDCPDDGDDGKNDDHKDY